MQRLFDIVLSALAMLVLSPLLIPIAIVLRFTGEGEIFYKQSRIGLRGERFGLFKFATMLKDSPNLGTGTVTVKNDPRVLPLGHFLRKSKINELPQLINIFLGDMSIIGPRPQTQNSFDAFPQSMKETILKIRPGLSGVGSIIFRDEENLLADIDDPVSMHHEYFMPYKGRLEMWYVANGSIETYFKLIFITAWTVLFPQSRIIWKAFPDLPPPPQELATNLRYHPNS